MHLLAAGRGQAVDLPRQLAMAQFVGVLELAAQVERGIAGLG